MWTPDRTIDQRRPILFQQRADLPNDTERERRKSKEPGAVPFHVKRSIDFPSSARELFTFCGLRGCRKPGISP